MYISGANELTFECYDYDNNLQSIAVEIGEYFVDKGDNCILLNFTDKYIVYSEEHRMYIPESENYIDYSSIVSFDYEDFKMCVDISK